MKENAWKKTHDSIFVSVKVWTGRGSVLHLVTEVREHNKAVTSLAVLQSGEKLYSGSLDKIIRVYFQYSPYFTSIETQLI